MSVYKDALILLEQIESELQYIKELASTPQTEWDWQKNGKQIVLLAERLEKEVEELVSRTYDEIHRQIAR
jgi:hypothetical protein